MRGTVLGGGSNGSGGGGVSPVENPVVEHRSWANDDRLRPGVGGLIITHSLSFYFLTRSHLPLSPFVCGTAQTAPMTLCCYVLHFDLQSSS